MECSICYCCYDEWNHFPRILSCGHTFCTLCLTRLLSTHSPADPLSLSCPICKETTLIQSLPSQPERLERSGVLLEDDVIELECEVENVNQLIKNYHLLETIQNLIKDNQNHSQKCSIHQKKFLEFYDQDCRRLICSHCLTIGDHQNHRCYPLDDHSLISRQDFTLMFSTLSSQLSNLIQITHRTNFQVHSLNNHYETKQKEIHQIFSDLFAELERQQTQALNQLELVYHHERTQLESQSINFSKLRERCECLLSDCQRVDLNDVTESPNLKRMRIHKDVEEKSEVDSRKQQKDIEQQEWLFVGEIPTQFDILQQEITSLSSSLHPSSIKPSNSTFLRASVSHLFEFNHSTRQIEVHSDQDLYYSLYLRCQCGDSEAFQRLKSFAESSLSGDDDPPDSFQLNLLNNLVAIGYYSMMIYENEVPTRIPIDPSRAQHLASLIYPLLRDLPLKTSHENLICGYLTATGLGIRKKKERVREGDVDGEVEEGEQEECDDMNETERMKIAIKYYQLSHSQGNSEAPCYLGEYYDPDYGHEPNLVKSLQWYEISAKRNHPVGLMSVGSSYLNGSETRRNHEEGLRYYRLAAEQNYYGAQYSLGLCYCSGSYVLRDETEGLRWFRLAADQGYLLAIEELEKRGEIIS